MMLNAPWSIDPGAIAVCAMLESAGHRALFVGGCVRNVLMGVPVSDLDIATDAHPERVMALAAQAGLKAIPTGIEHGTVTVVANGQPHEITTFRRDVETDGRRAVVAFTDQIEEDAARRDLTFNALYADIRGQVFDPLGGMADLKARRARFIGDAHQRIREDYLRILRFFRFYAQYGESGIDAEGLAACAELADGLDGLAAERITAEMTKLLGAPDPALALTAMAASGVLMRILPGADPKPIAPLVHLEDTPTDWTVRLVAVGGQQDRLRLSKAAQKRIEALIAAQDLGAAEAAYRLGVDAAKGAALILAASLGTPLAPDLTAQIALGAEAVFPVKAKDLMARGLAGPDLGQAIKALEADWIAAGFASTKDELLSGL